MNDSGMVQSNRILIVDDNPSIHEDIRKILCGQVERNEAFGNAKASLFGDDLPKCGQTRFELDSAHQGKEGLEMVQRAAEAGRPYSMAFVDVRMPPGWDGVETIRRIWKFHPDLQVVICTAYSDYSWEGMIQQIGKSDSLVILKKPFDNIEVLQLAHALTEKWLLSYKLKSRLNDLDLAVTKRTSELLLANEQLKGEIADRMQVEKALRLSEERFSKAFKASPIPLAIQSLKHEQFMDANEGFQQLIGFSLEELVGRTPHELNIWEDPEAKSAMLQKLHQQMSIRNLPCRLRPKSGLVRDVLLSVELFELEGEPLQLVIGQDITEQLSLESQLRQAQKMEAVGQLAAGVAHDFNNILTVIQGYSTLLLGGSCAEGLSRQPLETISAAATRAAKLVRQLLTFSRKQFVEMGPLDVRTTLANIADMLPRVLPENIIVSIKAPSDLPGITADAGMMEQMLMNLAVNARDAMPLGGELTISAELRVVGPAEARKHPDARTGQFLCLSVTDTGCGMTAEVLSHIFEPFFTTKPVGEGTGLGLATVYGIAKQHGGWTEVQSRPEHGATFRIFIPTCGFVPQPDTGPLNPEPVRQGKETILVVEDQVDVRNLVVRVLISHGYQAIVAGTGVEALEQWSKHAGEIDLVLTDMVMPGGLTGRQLGECLLAQDPGVKIVYSSGYSPTLVGQEASFFSGKYFLEKPYRPAKLLETLRRSLDEAP
jgi:PAS domain S-box-containing protein